MVTEYAGAVWMRLHADRPVARLKRISISWLEMPVRQATELFWRMSVGS